MNIDESELGQELKSFKDFTQDLPPPIKGLAVSSFRLMKDAQNSFGARFEMEDADLALEEEAKANNQRQDESDVAEEWEVSFHYIAYVYVSGSVWELDGLKKGPVKVCKFSLPCVVMHLLTRIISTGDCLPEEFERMAIGKMEHRIQQYPNGELHFSILALRRCRLRDARTERIRNARDLCAIDNLLTKLDPAWEENTREDILSGLYIVKAAKASDVAKFENMSGDRLKAERARYIAMQKAFDDTIATEQTELDNMNKSLERKRFDYEPFVLRMAQMVEEGGFVKEVPKQAAKTKGKRARR
jgi:ubiquitin carboxyl-terminal hydrolase L5